MEGKANGEPPRVSFSGPWAGASRQERSALPFSSSASLSRLSPARCSSGTTWGRTSASVQRQELPPRDKSEPGVSGGPLSISLMGQGKQGQGRSP